MLTLHKATEYTKMLVKWGIISIAAIFILIFVYRASVSIKEYFYPTPPPPTTVSFGKLPPVSFPILPSAKSLTYSIDTLTGNLPAFTDRVTIYKIVVNEPNLLAFKRAKERISKIGFNTPGTALNNTLYRWNDVGNNSLSRSILLDIQTFDFTLSSTFLTNSAIRASENLPNEKDVQSLAQSFLSNISSFPDDIELEKTKITLLSIKNSSVVPATSLSNTELIRVDFFQKDVDKLPIYYPNPPYSTMNVFVAGGDTSAQIVESHFSHRFVDTATSATYPIKTADEAFSELQKGDAYITSSPDSESQISIKNVSLGYYLSDKNPEYLMPIVVFRGDNGFYAYVSAIKDAWIQEVPSQ